jgi:transcriptional regulator with XRE-family HTH domain
MDNKEIFCRNLNYYMNEKQKSRKDVADAIDVSYFTFTDWVKGKTYPRMDKVERLAKYFNIKISDLIEKKSVEDAPVLMAEFHAEMIQDEDMVEIYIYLKNLNAKKRAIVKELARNLAED